MRCTLLAVVVAFFSVVTAGATAGVPTAPILRLEAGNHLSLITQVGTDAAGRYLVTASEDKTIRVWRSASGEALAVLRPPVGDGGLGAIYAAALSPDGNTIAAGGNTAFDGDNHALYLFDRASGTLPPGGTLSGLEAQVQRIAWSPDGQLIAVGLRQQGIRLFSRDLAYRGGDEEYNDAIYGLDIDRDGRRMAVASLDGFVRLYEFTAAGMRRIARKGLDAVPYAVAFSPDGRTLAVGYAEGARVDLLDAQTLLPQSRLGFDAHGNLGRVAWSHDGRYLFAAGTATRDGRFPVLRFDAGGRGTPRVMASFDNIVVSLAAMPDGGLAVGSAEPSWSILDADGTERVGRHRYAADFRDAGGSFRVSDDGRTVSFPFSAGGEKQANFDIRRGEVGVGPGPGKLAAPLTATRKLDIAGWHNGTRPTINGHAMAVLAGEVARSVAVAPEGRRVVLGTEWYLRAFDDDARPLWQQRLPATAWAVNVSGDGRWALAALGDGTIRWFRMTDGTPQVALFPHPDRERWVLWTPAGQYDTSVAGEGLIGWHLNGDYNRNAQFYPVGRFRQHYYRPELVRAVFDTGDLAIALRSAQRESDDGSGAAPDVTRVLPPRVELRGERDTVAADSRVRARFAVFSPADAPVEEIKVRVDGRLVHSLKGGDIPKARGSEGVELEVPVPLPPADIAEVAIIARNRNGISEPAVFQVQQEHDAPASRARYRNMYVFAAGVSAYPGLPPDLQLKFPAKDARDFVNVVEAHAAGLAEHVETRVLTDAQASRQHVLDALAWIRESVGPADIGLVFLAGHGFMMHNRYYFAGSDLDLSDEAHGIRSAVPGSAIQETLANLRGRGAFFLDTCHSGFVLSELKIKSDLTGALNDMGDERAVVILTGSAGRQSATEADEWNNGAFTKAIVEGLKGKADYAGSGLITPPLLHTYVSGRVRSMTDGLQTPKMVGAVFDEPIAIIRPQP
ncbi:MAG: caspase family protein [Rhodocyclaceae bacterium]|nr:caspase family protein [Rhodocyclaceae bacterium]